MGIFPPELFGVNGAPAEMLLLNLLLPLVEGAEFLVVRIKLLPQALKDGSNLGIDPNAVLKLGNDGKSINHRHMVHALLVIN